MAAGRGRRGERGSWAVEDVGGQQVRARITAVAVAAVTVVMVLPACRWRPPTGARPVYRVEVTRTPFGIPHVKAADWPSLGYGYGFAYAEDNLCDLADDVVRVNGERSRWLGDSTSNRNQDFFYQRIKDAGTVEELLARTPAEGGISDDVRLLVRGYAAGVNRYLRDTGVEALPDPRCRGQAWVRPISELDLWRSYYRTGLFASSVALLDNIIAAQPPAAGSGAAGSGAGGAGGAGADAAPPFPEILSQQADTFALGSNGVALGRDATVGGTGMVLANPHFPWDGPQRFYEAHLTIPGRYDAIGVSLAANPVIQIGHNDRVAWTHTVSTARRFTIDELTLVPGDPTAYVVDGEVRRMTRQDVTIQVRQPDGTLAPSTHTFWRSDAGPIVTVSILGWSETTAFALRDVNESPPRAFDGYIAMGRSRSIADLRAAMDEYQHLPWINTIAADHTGTAYYGDHSVVPNVSNERLAACITPTGQFALPLAGVFVLDGSRSTCGWATDPDAERPGIFGPAKLPQLVRTDYVTNSNDSYWLSNPASPLEGFARIIGEERTTRSLRTRLGLLQVQQRLDGSDGLGGTHFTRDQLQQVMFSNRVLGGELVRDDLVALCRANPTVVVDGRAIALSEACDVLAAWDGRVDLESRGAHLFRAFTGFGGLQYSAPFDASDPVTTPRTLATGNPAVLTALGRAVARYQDGNIPLDAQLGTLQSEPRGSEAIQIHGGTGGEGAFNVISASFVAGVGFPNVTAGASFIMVAELGRHGVASRAILAYSQSANPESPHHADQTRAYSQKAWIDLPYSERDVRRAAVSRIFLTERVAPRP